MTTVRTRSFARAGLLGNPSDGYFGKTLSFAFADFGVDLCLTESARMRFVPGEVDDATFDSPEQLVHDLRLFGYYGGIRLLMAIANTLRKLVAVYLSQPLLLAIKLIWRLLAAGVIREETFFLK